jgi:hypothetical protein
MQQRAEKVFLSSSIVLKGDDCPSKVMNILDALQPIDMMNQ